MDVTKALSLTLQISLLVIKLILEFLRSASIVDILKQVIVELLWISLTI